MSRVSDALHRAAEDRAQQIERGAYDWIPRKKTAAKKEAERAPEPVEAPAASPPRVSVSRKSWRERFEELLFGRDLKRLDSHPLISLEKESAAAEQYRILREQVRTLRNGSAPHSISVTSPLKHDGKTTVAVNLALALALGGDEQVLLIDADLRNPDVHKYFDVPRAPGLTDYMTAGANGNLSSYVKETSYPGLRIIPGGSASDRAEELLGKERMKSLMEQLRTVYPDHQLIIDSPPVLATSDPLVLAREVAGVLMVIRAGRTRREYLRKAVETLNSPKLMGFVLNGAPSDAASRYYRKQTASA